MIKSKSLSLTLLICLLCLISGFALIGCGETPPAQPTKYKIILPESNIYEISANETTATKDTVITLTVETSNPAYKILEIRANNTICEKTSNTTYTFTMPEADVTITVDTAVKEINSDDGIYWAINTPNQISKAQDGDNYASQTINFDFSENINNPQYSLVSTNENIIPNEAMAVNFTDANMGSMKKGGSITIDLTQVNLGTTYLIFNVKTSSMGYTNGTITKKIEVVEYGQVVVTTWTNTINFDLSRIYEDYHNKGTGITITVRDSNQIYGANYEKVTEVIASSEEESIAIQYVPNHAYTISVIVVELQEDNIHYNILAEFVINDTIEGFGTGDDEEDFNRYLDNELYFVYDGASIDLTVLPPENN